MRIPKFEDKKSLCFGVLAGFFLVFSGMLNRWLLVGVFQQIIGFVLAVHCWDMLRQLKRDSAK